MIISRLGLKNGVKGELEGWYKRGSWGRWSCPKGENAFVEWFIRAIPVKVMQASGRILVIQIHPMNDYKVYPYIINGF